jgi:hypothetical protein
MHPMNFPGRKNERRIRALAQLRKPRSSKAIRLGRPPGFDREAEIKRLQELIIPANVAAGIRTKKDRSSRARFRN